MGREMRRVPKNWQHPTEFSRNNDVRFKPLFEGPWEEHAARWDEDNWHWEAGEDRHWGRNGEPDTWKAVDPDYLIDCPTYEEWDGPRPVPEDYMPTWTPEEATYYMMYESTSEGTPISPAFETPEELALWLADLGASTFADMTASYEEWLPACRGSFAPSMVLVPGVGLISGVEAAAKWDSEGRLVEI